MAASRKKSPATSRRSTIHRARGKLAPGSRATGLDAADVAIAMDSAEISEVVALVQNAGGALTGAYPAEVKNFKVESVSNSDLAWVAVGAAAQN